MAALALLAVAAPTARADGGAAERPYDGGIVLVDGRSAGDIAHALAVQYFAGGSPPVRWVASAVPVRLCTQQANRPAAISAERFRDTVTRAAELWNAGEAAIGVRYDGDCVTQGAWREGNGVNEVAWDDQRNEVRSPAAAVTQGRWFEFFGRREFTEADIILGDGLSVPDVCLQSIVSHEVGHVLGFGHSDRRGDLMYPSFNASDVSSCAAQAAADEVALLQGLYGVNRAPVIAPAILQAATAGALSQLTVRATDPEGDPLTYRWTQTAGPAVALTDSGASASFIAPNLPGATLSFRVNVLDSYRHGTATTLNVNLARVSVRPASAPAVESYRPGAEGARSVLRWTPVPEATFYRVCTTVDVIGGESCADQPDSSVSVTWSTILGPGADPGASRVLTSGTRAVAVAACNTLGCSDFGRSIHAGGVTWGSGDADFDVIGQAIDYPAAGIRFTVAGVVNISGAPRRFTLYAGSVDAPYQLRIQSCGSVAAGASCLGVLTPGQTGHLPVITVVSERDGAPSLEYRLPIR